MEKAREFQKNIYFCFTDYAKAFDRCGSLQTVENSSRNGNTRPPFRFLLTTLNAGSEATVRTGHRTTDSDWFEIEKGVHQGCILSPYLFNLYAEHIM